MPDIEEMSISVHLTQRAVLMEQYHRDTGIGDGVTVRQATAIGRDIGLTVAEMAVFVGARLSDIKKWVKADKFPPHMALHFKMLHSTVTSASPLLPYHLLPKLPQIHNGHD